jgi:hypothetical protein
MKHNVPGVLLGTIAVLLYGLTAFAHHSIGATYDESKKVTVEGKIVQILLRNPHSFLHIEALDQAGQPQRYSLEWRSIGQLNQEGIKRDTLKSGEAVVITMNPSRTAADFKGLLLSLHRKSDGFGWGVRPGESVE